MEPPATTYLFSDLRRLHALSAARAPAGLERGGDRSAGPAGGRAARGERSEPLESVTKVVTQSAACGSLGLRGARGPVARAVPVEPASQRKNGCRAPIASLPWLAFSASNLSQSASDAVRPHRILDLQPTRTRRRRGAQVPRHHQRRR